MKNNCKESDSFLQEMNLVNKEGKNISIGKALKISKHLQSCHKCKEKHIEKFSLLKRENYN